ncbi:MAG: hypothetical protein DRR08_18410 [Candidatus Parabeggiatoa sp. nov. 2]|nr:MAG: hypothetical protein B6247_17755 [Beggiatoa sp. 4572_84]RKZ57682.1 MAG: hypothetical protein DRR08_18410 [Gammaproteobacteria bacterium]
MKGHCQTFSATAKLKFGLRSPAKLKFGLRSLAKLKFGLLPNLMALNQSRAKLQALDVKFVYPRNSLPGRYTGYINVAPLGLG